MTTIIQLSDIHFGPSHVAHLDELILNDINALNPDLVILSGDFTMRARLREYEEARDFIKRIPKPTLTIPGNHDQPLFEPFERLMRPYARYQKYICSDIDCSLTADGLFVLGLNDNDRFLPGGFWSRQQRAWLNQQLTSAPRNAFKIIVTHHHLMWEGKWRPAGFWFPNRTLDLLAQRGVELVLNGHTHIPVAVQTPQGIVVARAGTASSGRIRHGNRNSYNLISFDDKQINVFVRDFDERADAFVATRAFTFPRRSRRLGEP